MKRMLYNTAQFALLVNAACSLTLIKLSRRRRDRQR